MASGDFGHVQPYIDYFVDKGHEVYFIALSPSPNRKVRTINVWRGSVSTFNIKTQKWKYVFAGMRARHVIKRLKPDVVNAHYATSGGLAGWLSGHKRLIITVHGSDVNIALNSPIWRCLIRIFFKQAKLIHVVSDELMHRVRELGIPVHKIINCNVGINFDQFYINRIVSTEYFAELRMVCNRAFEPLYDHLTIVNALEIVKSEGIPFTICFIGDGSLMTVVKNRVRYCGLEKHVSFLGYVPNKDQVSIFKNNNIYISASHSDGTSLSLLEAMASGLLPVVTSINANCSLLECNETAMMFQPADYSNMASTLIKLYRECPINVSKAIDRNQQLANELGNRSRNMRKIEDAFNQCAHNSSFGG